PSRRIPVPRRPAARKKSPPAARSWISFRASLRKPKRKRPPKAMAPSRMPIKSRPKPPPIRPWPPGPFSKNILAAADVEREPQSKSPAGQAGSSGTSLVAAALAGLVSHPPTAITLAKKPRSLLHLGQRDHAPANPGGHGHSLFPTLLEILSHHTGLGV